MFFRIKKSAHRAYVQVVENKGFDGAVRQSVIANCWLSASGGIGGAGHKIGTRTEKFEVLWARRWPPSPRARAFHSPLAR